MKRILIVTTVESTVSGFLLPHIQHLMSRGIDVEVATCLNENSSLKDVLPGVVIYNVPFNRSVRSYKNLVAIGKLNKIIKQNKFNLIHVHTPIASFIARLVNSFNNIPLIYTAHGFHFNENGNILSNFIFKIAEKIAGNWLDKLIVINDEDYKQGKTIVKQTKLTKVNGIGINDAWFNKANVNESTIIELKKELNINRNNKVIVHIAEFNGNKRQIDIVESAKILRGWRNDFTFLLVGDGQSRNEIQRYIEKENLQENVKLLGFRRDIRQLLAISDVGLNVSLREGLPRSVMEMMAMELPVIATNIRGNRELIIEDYNGYLIQVKNPLQIANRCDVLLEDYTSRQLFGRRGREIIASKYRLSNILVEIDKIYEEFDL